MRLNSKLISFGLAAAWGVLLAGSAQAQFASQGVSMFSNITLSTFGSTSGNSCWGYVSPSGRQYAIMGLNNKVAFIEVTNPNAPVWFASIAHSSGTWCDIKSYQDVAYTSSENTGSGIQVIDMANIDNHQVTLVRTLTSPGRTHTLVINQDTGYLYTCGSRNGTGTTMCFDVHTNPRNPVQVGPLSMTTQYQHEGLSVSYTSGPYAGKEIWFGFSEGRGVDIYDFTNKAVPVKLTTATYPNMRYCHQGWISADKKYLYVNDELDEPNVTSVTRTLMFDVEDLSNPIYLGTFSTGLAAIDHNEYWVDGFIFQSNYTTGLRIFDAENPLAPVETGFFDTYPNNDGATFNGAWNNWAWFPNGSVMISDINRGFFLVDPTNAVTRTRIPTSYFLSAGRTINGNAGSFADSDNVYLEIANNPALDLDGPPMQAIVSAKAFDSSPMKLRVLVESNGVTTTYKQSIALKNWSTGDYEEIGTGNVRLVDGVVTAEAGGNLSRFVKPGTLDVEAQIGWSPSGQDVFNARVRIDEINILVTR